MASKFFIITGAALTAIAVVIAVSIMVGRIRRRRMIRRLEQIIVQRRRMHIPPQPWDTLPVPVQRYLHRSVSSAPPAELIEVWEEGEFRTFSNPRWGKLRARALYSGIVPGMIWNALVWHSLWQWYTIELLYTAGIGKGTLKLWNALVLFDPDGQEANEALLTRVLMETVWFPTSLVPGGLLHWEPLKGNVARAVLNDHGITIRADFHFTDDGEIDHIVTLDKYRDADTGFERNQCTMYCQEWRTIHGIRIPTLVRLEWNLPEGNFEYMRIRIRQVSYR